MMWNRQFNGGITKYCHLSIVILSAAKDLLFKKLKAKPRSSPTFASHPGERRVVAQRRVLAG